jgi:predicted MFS family arabinose efflux permease
MPYVLGALIGTSSTGLVIDKCGSRTAAIYLLILCVITQLLLLYYNEREKFDGLAYLVSMLCGFEEQSLQTYVTAVLGNEFTDKVVPYAAHNIYRMS